MVQDWETPQSLSPSCQKTGFAAYADSTSALSGSVQFLQDYCFFFIPQQLEFDHAC